MTVDNFLTANLSYKLPFTKDELRFLLENETTFKRQKRMNIDLFMKNFCPDGSLNKEMRSASNSSGEERSLVRSVDDKDADLDKKNSFG